MKRILLTCLFTIAILPSFGQTQKIAHLKYSINIAQSKELKLAALLKLFDECETLPKDTLWNYAIRAKSLAAQLKNKQGYSLALLAQANAYLRWDNTDSARALIEPELLKYKLDDAETRGTYFKLALAKIDFIGESSDYKDALAQVYDVMRAAELYKDSVVVADCMNTVCAWDYDMDFLQQSREWGYKAFTYTNPLDPKFYNVLNSLYLNLGNNYKWIKNLDSATYFVDKAVQLSQKTQNLFYLSVGLQKKAAIYSDKKEYARAEAAISQSIKIIKVIEGDAPQQDKLIVLASVYQLSGKVDSAIKVLKDGLELAKIFDSSSPHAKKGVNAMDLQRVFYYQELAKCYQLKGDSKNYEATLEKIIAGKDAFYKANSADAIAELETKYQVQKNAATIARQKLALTKDKYLFFGSIILSLLVGIISLLLFRDYRGKQKLKMQRLQDEEKSLATLAVAEAEEGERKRIAADLHDNLGAQLSFIKRNVNFIIDQPDGFSKTEEKKYLGFVNDTAQNAMIDLRETIWILNKPEVDVQDFADKLKSYLRQQLLDKDLIRWEYKETIKRNWNLSSGEVMHIFRIAQELVSNIIKHSGANKIDISFYSDEPNNYRLVIADNGKGFNPKSKYDGHYGLENLHHRANVINAKLYIESAIEMGTRVMLTKGSNNTFELYDHEQSNSIFTG